MRIGIIALNFQPGAMGGVETYFRTLLAQLQRLDTGNEYMVVLPKGGKSEIPVTNPRFRIVEFPMRRNGISRLLRLLTFVPEKGFRGSLARRIDALGCRLLHFPLQVMLPFAVTTPAVVSCMDIQQEYLPAFFSRSQLFLRRVMHGRSLLRANHIITISRYVESTLGEKYGIEAEKMTTIYPSVDETLFTEERDSPPASELPENYFFYPAVGWPHKNHGRLLRAFSLVIRRFPHASLVLSGISAPHRARLDELIGALNLRGHVRVLGFLKYEELASVYRRAYALVFPSLYEGFGIPVVEAMHAGCPVICSRVTSLPEVAGTAAVYCNPLDEADIARAMLELQADPQRRAQLVAEGRRNAIRFSGRRLAEETVAVYERYA